MKSTAVTFVVGVVALLVGLGLGGIGPRAELRALEEQLEQVAECESESVGSEIANVFRGRPWEEDRGRKVKRFATDPEPTPDPEPAPTPDPEPGLRIEIGDDEPSEPADLEEGLGMAREAMELRYAQARAALVEDARPSDDQLAQIDATMKQMNDDLIGLANDLVTEMESGTPDRRQTMLYAAETLDVLLSAEDDLRGTLTDSQIGALQDESLDPLSYVDPAIVDVLEQMDRN